MEDYKLVVRQITRRSDKCNIGWNVKFLYVNGNFIDGYFLPTDKKMDEMTDKEIFKEVKTLCTKKYKYNPGGCLYPDYLFKDDSELHVYNAVLITS